MEFLVWVAFGPVSTSVETTHQVIARLAGGSRQNDVTHCTQAGNPRCFKAGQPVIPQGSVFDVPLVEQRSKTDPYGMTAQQIPSG